MENLEQYIELINNSKTPEEAFDNYCLIMEKNGYGRAVYSLVTDHPSLDLPRQHGLITNYPEHWMNHYIGNGYIDIDPVIERVSVSRKPFFWSDLSKDSIIPDSSKLLMDQADEAGVSDGIGISLCGAPGEIVGVGLARTDRNIDKARDYQFMSNAYLVTVFFHETYRNMVGIKNEISLSAREEEILSWGAEGKTDDEIGTILTISLNTVRFHWKNIFSKMEAYGRVYAITKAIRLGLISPIYIKSTYQKR